MQFWNLRCEYKMKVQINIRIKNKIEASNGLKVNHFVDPNLILDYGVFSHILV